MEKKPVNAIFWRGIVINPLEPPEKGWLFEVKTGNLTFTVSVKTIEEEPQITRRGGYPRDQDTHKFQARLDAGYYAEIGLVKVRESAGILATESHYSVADFLDSVCKGQATHLQPNSELRRLLETDNIYDFLREYKRGLS